MRYRVGLERQYVYRSEKYFETLCMEVLTEAGNVL